MPSCQISPLRLSCDFAADPLGIEPDPPERLPAARMGHEVGALRGLVLEPAEVRVLG